MDRLNILCKEMYVYFLPIAVILCNTFLGTNQGKEVKSEAK